MNFLPRLLTVALALSAGSAIASAATIGIESYGTNLNSGAVNTFSGSNTALSYLGLYNGSTLTPGSSSKTYNLPANSPWASLPANTNSSWVSFDPTTAPGGNVAPSGTYVYTSTFLASAFGSGTITVLADDTTSIYLNNTLITPAAAAVQGQNCTSGTPNCLVASTYNLAGFVNGVNTLSFGVVQDFGGATGLDFAGTVAQTPEPSSLALFATGLVGAAGAIRRRLRA